jgi:hypothetical protein
MAFEHITVEQKERITILTMNRPEVMNAISPQTSAEKGLFLPETILKPRQPGVRDQSHLRVVSAVLPAGLTVINPLSPQ